MQREPLLTGLTEQERRFGEVLLDLAEQVMDRGEPVRTDFYEPDDREVAAGIFGSLERLAFRTYGGNRKAVRQRFVVFPSTYLAELLEMPVRAVQVRADEKAVDTDQVRSALLLAGIEQGELGDLLVAEGGCQAVVASEALERALAVQHADGVPVSVSEIDIERLAYEPAQRKEIRTTVASLRTDAVAAAGFRISRTKAAREVRTKRLKRNWQPVRNPSMPVEEGDVLSIAGRGRVRLVNIDGQSRRGRWIVHLERTM